MIRNLKPRLRHRLRGIFQKGIPFEVRNPSGDWSLYFGTYEGQKHLDVDSNCCWAFSGNECLEDSLEFLWKTGKLSKETTKWFQDNGYIDADGDFYLSRRFIPILSGATNTGNDQAEFCRLTGIYGAIPNSMLPFTTTEEYFDKTKITPAMLALGKEFLKRISVPYQEVGTRWKAKTLAQLKTALQQAECQIGIPVPQDGSWNSGRIKWNGDKNPAHAVALYKVDETADYDYPIFIYDQYEPHLKQLSRDYYIPMMSQMVVSEIPQRVSEPMLSPVLSLTVWEKFIIIMRKIGLLKE